MHKTTYDRFLALSNATNIQFVRPKYGFDEKFAEYFKARRSSYTIQSRLPGWTGDHLLKQESYKKAVEYYDKGLLLHPNDAWYYLRRSRGNEKYFRLEKAAADLRRALQFNPFDLQTIARHVHLLYLNGEFEKALQIGFDKSKIRVIPPTFKEEYLNAYYTLENAIGKEAGYPLRDYFLVIRNLAWQKNLPIIQTMRMKRKKNKKSKSKTSILIDDSLNNNHDLRPAKPPKSVKPRCKKVNSENMEYLTKKQVVFSEKRKEGTKYVNTQDSVISLSRDQSLLSSLASSSILQEQFLKLHIPRLENYPFRPIQNRTLNIENFMACNYLRQLFNDKLYLNKISQIAGYIGKSPKTNEMITAASKDGLEILDQAQEVLHKRKPMYHIIYQKSLRTSKKQELDNIEIKEKKKKAITAKIKDYMSIIAECAEKIDLKLMMKTSEMMYKLCKSVDKKTLPERENILCKFYILEGEAFLLSYRFTKDMTDEMKLTMVNLVLGLPTTRTVTQEPLFRKMKELKRNWSNLIYNYEQQVKVCTCSEELIWLYHELTRFNIELKRFTLAKTYANRCVYEARKCENFKWAFNGYMLIVRISGFIHNRNDSMKNLRIALITVKQIGNEAVEVFLKKCLKVMDEYKFEYNNAEQIFKTRQEKIMNLMPSYEKKRKLSSIFNRVNQSPPDRRFMIVPGVFRDSDYYDQLEREKEERMLKLKKKKEEKTRGLTAVEELSLYL